MNSIFNNLKYIGNIKNDRFIIIRNSTFLNLYDLNRNRQLLTFKYSDIFEFTDDKGVEEECFYLLTDNENKQILYNPYKDKKIDLSLLTDDIVNIINNADKLHLDSSIDCDNYLKIESKNSANVIDILTSKLVFDNENESKILIMRDYLVYITKDYIEFKNAIYYDNKRIENAKFIEFKINYFILINDKGFIITNGKDYEHSNIKQLLKEKYRKLYFVDNSDNLNIMNIETGKLELTKKYIVIGSVTPDILIVQKNNQNYLFSMFSNTFVVVDEILEINLPNHLLIKYNGVESMYDVYKGQIIEETFEIEQNVQSKTKLKSYL